MTLEDSIKEMWEPISDVPPPEWVVENVELPADSELKTFDFTLFPLALFVITQLCSNEFLKRFTEVISTQFGKTMTILAALQWKIVNKPSGVAWYTDTGINAKGDFKTKILPAFESNKKIAPMLPSDRKKIGNTLIQFPSMNLRVLGAESKSNREGKTISEVYCDEVRNYPDGAIEQIDARFKTITNHRRVLFSSCGPIEKEPWPSFMGGTRHLGFWNCPHCQHKQTFRFGLKKSPLYPKARKCGGFIWDTNAITRPNDEVWNIVEVCKTIRYQCENESCKHEFRELEKLDLIKNTVFEQTNPMADESDISVHCWEAYSPFSGCSWAAIVTKFLKALVTMEAGFIEPMKVFVTETLAEPWEDNRDDEEQEINSEEFNVKIEWADEKFRFMTVDCQANLTLFYVVIRAWAASGENRRLWRGRLDSFEAIRDKQKEFGVKPQFVGIDPQYEATTIYRQCCRYIGANMRGWSAMQSTGQKSFTHKLDDGYQELIYAPRTPGGGPYGNPLLGFKSKDAENWLSTVSPEAAKLYKAGHLRCRIYPFSRSSANDILQNLIEGKDCHKLTSPISEAEEAEEKHYRSQLAGEKKKVKQDKQGRDVEEWAKVGPNHYRACEQMQVVKAAMAGALAPKVV